MGKVFYDSNKNMAQKIMKKLNFVIFKIDFDIPQNAPISYFHFGNNLVALKFALSGANVGKAYLKCPPKLFYDDTEKQCCRYERRSRDQGRSGKCQDLAAPGRPSDCPANKERCNDPLWRDLMTEQCPKTCNRCAEWAGLNKQRGDVASEFRREYGQNLAKIMV